jgi:hypothetical protein
MQIRLSIAIASRKRTNSNILLQDYGIKDRASAMHWRSLIGAIFVYC